MMAEMATGSSKANLPTLITKTLPKTDILSPLLFMSTPTTRKPLFVRPPRNTLAEEGTAFHQAIAALPDLLLAMEHQLDPLIPQEAKTKSLKLAMEKAGYTFP